MRGVGGLIPATQQFAERGKIPAALEKASGNYRKAVEAGIQRSSKWVFPVNKLPRAQIF